MGYWKELKKKAKAPLDSKGPGYVTVFHKKTTVKLGVFPLGLCVQILWKVFVIVSIIFILCFSIILLGDILVDDQCL